MSNDIVTLIDGWQDVKPHKDGGYVVARGMRLHLNSMMACVRPYPELGSRPFTRCFGLTRDSAYYVRVSDDGQQAQVIHVEHVKPTEADPEAVWVVEHYNDRGTNDESHQVLGVVTGVDFESLPLEWERHGDSVAWWGKMGGYELRLSRHMPGPFKNLPLY